MKKVAFLMLITFILSQEAFAVDMPSDLKTFLQTKFPGITFKIDNSFVINNETYLPLTSLVKASLKGTSTTKKIEIVYVVPDKMLPKLFWFSNEWIFVKLIKHKDGTQTILDLKDIPTLYRERFLKTKFPGDLVIPKGLTIKEELTSLIGELPIKIIKKEPESKKQEKAAEAVNPKPQPSALPAQPLLLPSGILYLTSPDTGKIVFVELNDLSMIQYIQIMGAPWEISFDKINKLVFVTDFAKDQIHELKLQETSVFKSIELPSMSSPREIKLSDDGSLAYVLESLANDFAVYKTSDAQAFTKTKLPPNPANFANLKEANLIAITCSSTNRLVFLNATDFSRANQIMIDGNPEKVISDPIHKVFYTANRNGNTISVVDGNTKSVKKIIKVGETPTSLALDPGSKWLYVGNGKSNSISIINLEEGTVKDTIPLGAETQFPGDIELTKDSNYLIVTSETTNTISIIDLALKKVAIRQDVGATTHAALLIDKE